MFLDFKMKDLETSCSGYVHICFRFRRVEKRRTNCPLVATVQSPVGVLKGRGDGCDRDSFHGGVGGGDNFGGGVDVKK